MSQISSVEVPAAKSGTSTLSTSQGATPTTSQPAADNSRSPELQGNTYTEKKPLTDKEKDELILDAIQKRQYAPVKEWGCVDLYYLFAYEHKDYNYVGTEECVQFFRELLLFIARPAIAQAFGGAVKEGLKKIERLSKFFADLDSNSNLHEFIDYMLIESGVEDDDYERIAKKYLSGEDLEAVLNDEKPKPTASLWNMQPLTVEPEPCELTDDQLVEALDRYYPGHQWPADKRTIATQDRMKGHLAAREKERLSILTETPEQTQKRLVRESVYAAINAPVKKTFTIPPSRLPLSVTPLNLSKKAGSPTAKKKPASKPTTAKKKKA